MGERKEYLPLLGCIYQEIGEEDGEKKNLKKMNQLREVDPHRECEEVARKREDCIGLFVSCICEGKSTFG